MSRLRVAMLSVLLLVSEGALAKSLVASGDAWGDDSWGDGSASDADGWESDSWDDGAGQTGSREIALHGFSELAIGVRSGHDPLLAGEDYTLAEFRNRLELEQGWGETRLSLKADIFAEGVDHGSHGRLREARLDLSLSEATDLRAGRQVLTWGSGDLLFLNDLFPKDWVSFFAGRDNEYLKAPSDSVKLSHFASAANVDLVWTPRFSADHSIRGQRFSYFSSLVGEQVAQSPATLEEDSGEWALRIYSTRGSVEWALYGYHGFWKQPNSMAMSGVAFHSPLSVYGASVRDNLMGGVGNLELAWYETSDGSGADPAIPNDQLRFLSGYEREIRARLTLGLQYYLEWTQQYGALKQAEAANPFRPGQFRHLVSVRLTQRLMQDNLLLSWFSFWSPSDRDWLLRPTVEYRLNDQLSLTAGANLFGGRARHTFFGQFEDASNLYLRMRYSF